MKTPDFAEPKRTGRSEDRRTWKGAFLHANALALFQYWDLMVKSAELSQQRQPSAGNRAVTMYVGKGDDSRKCGHIIPVVMDFTVSAMRWWVISCGRLLVSLWQASVLVISAPPETAHHTGRGKQELRMTPRHS